MPNRPQSESSHPDDLPRLAERLDLLFRTVPRDDDGSQLHTSTSIVEALQQLNISVTPNHIRALRNGRRRNPSFRLLAGLRSEERRVGTGGGVRISPGYV